MPAHLLKSPLFSLWIEPAAHLSYVKLSSILTSNSGLFSLFQWPTCLSLCIHHVGLLQRFYCVCCIWSKFISLSFLIILSYSWTFYHVKFKIISSSSQTSPSKVEIEIALSVWEDYHFYYSILTSKDTMWHSDLMPSSSKFLHRLWVFTVK